MCGVEYWQDWHVSVVQNIIWNEPISFPFSFNPGNNIIDLYYQSGQNTSASDVRSAILVNSSNDDNFGFARFRWQTLGDGRFF